MVADDEEPSEMCWDFAQTPPFPARFGIPIIPIKGRKVWTYDVGVSDRLLHRRGWRWIGGFEGHSEGARMVTMSDNPGVLIWHYLLDAPREERVAKAARYTIVSGRPETDKDNLRRVLWEDNPRALRDLPPQLEKLLPKETTNGETIDGAEESSSQVGLFSA